jgi:ketosteroid isomerase-like protein
MSQENVETLRQGLDAFFRRDRQAWLALCDPDFETDE